MLGIDVEAGGQPAGLRSRTKPQGQDEKGAMAGTDVEPSKTTHGEITLDLSAARPGGRGETRRRPGGRWTGRRTKGGRGGGGGETRGSDVPSRRISPLTLLSYKWGYHLRWPQRHGERERVFFLMNDCAMKKLAGAPIW